MKVVQRFALDLQDEQCVKMHWLGDATVQVVEGIIWLFVSVEDELPKKDHFIYIVGNKQQIPMRAVRLLGSFVRNGEVWLVYH